MTASECMTEVLKHVDKRITEGAWDLEEIGVGRVLNGEAVMASLRRRALKPGTRARERRGIDYVFSAELHVQDDNHAKLLVEQRLDALYHALVMGGGQVSP